MKPSAGGIRNIILGNGRQQILCSCSGTKAVFACPSLRGSHQEANKGKILDADFAVSKAFKIYHWHFDALSKLLALWALSIVRNSE
jgi:hypothetical protein